MRGQIAQSPRHGGFGTRHGIGDKCSRGCLGGGPIVKQWNLGWRRHTVVETRLHGGRSGRPRNLSQLDDGRTVRMRILSQLCVGRSGGPTNLSQLQGGRTGRLRKRSHLSVGLRGRLRMCSQVCVGHASQVTFAKRLRGSFDVFAVFFSALKAQPEQVTPACRVYVPQQPLPIFPRFHESRDASNG